MATLAEDFDKARAFLEEAERAGAESGSRWEHAWSYVFLATSSLSEDRWAEADIQADRARALMGADGDPELLAWVQLIRGFVAWKQGQNHRAAHLFFNGSERFRELGGLWGLTFALLGAGLILTTANERGYAVRAFSAAMQLRETAGTGVHPWVVIAAETALDRLQDELDAVTFESEWEAGKRYSLADALQVTGIALTGLLDGVPTTE